MTIFYRAEHYLEQMLAAMTGQPAKEHRAANIVLADIITAWTSSKVGVGPVRLATSAETLTGTDDTTAVTPADLAAKLAGAGVMTLATLAEAKAGVNTLKATTPADVNAVIKNIIPVSFAGVHVTAPATSGPCTATGFAVNDVVLSVVGIGGVFGDQHANFESTISVVNQIRQTDVADLTANHYLAMVYRPS